MRNLLLIFLFLLLPGPIGERLSLLSLPFIRVRKRVVRVEVPIAFSSRSRNVIETIGVASDLNLVLPSESIIFTEGIHPQQKVFKVVDSPKSQVVIYPVNYKPFPNVRLAEYRTVTVLQV